MKMQVSFQEPISYYSFPLHFTTQSGHPIHLTSNKLTLLEDDKTLLSFYNMIRLDKNKVRLILNCDETRTPGELEFMRRITASLVLLWGIGFFFGSMATFGCCVQR